MRMEEFAEEVLKEVMEKAGASLSVQTVSANKNNGVTLTGITASKHEGKGGVCIYLDNYYEYYCDNRITLDEVTEDVYCKLMEHCNDLDGVDMDSLRKWDTVKARIRAKLVNREMNCEFLKKVPHRDFLDLAVIYYVTVEGLPEGVNGAFTVSGGNMEAWKIGEDDLYHAAVSNMRHDGEPIFEDMQEILRGMIPGVRCPFTSRALNIRPYVLTNPQEVFGAAELLDGGTLKGIGDKLGSDYIVLPSSVHECIIIPSDKRMSYGNIAEIVWGVNREQVVMEERLSDHVYLYERGEGTLRIVA